MDKMSAITIYRSVIPTFEELPPEDFKTLVLAYWHYAFDGEEPTGLSIYQKALFESLRANIDASNKRRVEAAERKKESREKRKAKLEESISSQSQNVTTCHNLSQDVTECHNLSQDVTVTSQDVTTCHKMSRTNVNVDVDVNENVNVNVDENVNENVNVDVDENVNVDNIKESGEKISPQPSRKKFVKPTLEEVRNYCIERKNNVNPEKFIDFYESKDWYIGKNKMKDWKAAVRTWEGRNSNGYTNSISNRVDVVDTWLTGGAND